MSRLDVSILDTVGDRGVQQMKPKPSHSSGIFIDTEFPKEKALGNYVTLFDWKTPQVRWTYMGSIFKIFLD